MSGKKEYALFAWDDPLPFFRISYAFLRDARKNSRKAEKIVEAAPQ